MAAAIQANRRAAEPQRKTKTQFSASPRLCGSLVQFYGHWLNADAVSDTQARTGTGSSTRLSAFQHSS
jgi:hypothetical protein